MFLRRTQLCRYMWNGAGSSNTPKEIAVKEIKIDEAISKESICCIYSAFALTRNSKLQSSLIKVIR